MVHRYAVALGYSMAQSNGDYFKAVGVDMILLTYSDIKFSLKSVREIEAVGWKMRQVSLYYITLNIAKKVFRAALNDESLVVSWRSGASLR